jgi:cell division GTPase FtsZ
VDRTRGIQPYQWKPGQTGNPKGRPRRKRITDALSEFLDAVDANGVSAAQKIAIAMIMQAMKGDIQHAKEILNRTEGAVKQSVDVLFGDMTDDELREFIRREFADQGGSPDGSEGPRDGSAQDNQTASG